MILLPRHAEPKELRGVSRGSASSGGAAAPGKAKQAESPDAEQRRRERLAHRLHAD